MLWSPNFSAVYGQTTLAGPTGNQEQPPITAEDFQLLDTNGDGQLTSADDPFLPYYPGDDVVDWIGISLYNYGRSNDGTGIAPPVDENYFVSQISNGPNSFYERFVSQKSKPFIISETGAALAYNAEGQQPLFTTEATVEQEVESKRAWWQAILGPSIAQQNGPLSRLKAAVWFEENKLEGDYVTPQVNVVKDFRITANPSVRQAFLNDARSLGSRLTAPGSFKFACNGEFSFQ